jgi:hypothetical protein
LIGSPTYFLFTFLLYIFFFLFYFFFLLLYTLALLDRNKVVLDFLVPVLLNQLVPVNFVLLSYEQSLGQPAHFLEVNPHPFAFV